MTAIGIAAAVGIFLLVWCSSSEGHDFYSPACCSGRDCAPAALGDVVWTPAGYVVHSMQETIPLDDRRIQFSPPGEPGYRLCIPKFGDKVRCLYIPEPEG